MNQITAPESEPEITAPSVVTGQRLREAREALGLSRDDVARELRLHEKLIGALEEGERSQLPPTAFISGYLRAYARLLGLPADQLIAEYLNEQVAPSLYRATDRTGMPRMTSSDPKFRYTSYVVTAGLLLLLLAWWASQNLTVDSLLTAQSSAAHDGQQAIEATLPGPMPLYQDPPIEEIVTEGQAQPMAPNAAPAPAQSTGKVPSASAVTAAPAIAMAPASATPEAAKPPQPAPVVVAEPLSPATAQSLLRMEYQAASWTQVEDADGRVLVHEVINPGRKLELRGVAPFKVFLGYAPGVLVYYNGTLFAHSAYHRGDLARFNVGTSQDNRPLAR